MKILHHRFYTFWAALVLLFISGCISTGSIPPVEDVSVKAIAAAAGIEHSLVLKNDGTLWIAEWNYYSGRLNINSTIGTNEHNFIQAVDTAGPMNNVVFIAAGESDSFVIKNDGTLWMAQHNNSSRLKSDNSNKQNIFTQLPVSDVVAVAVGEEHCLILKADGTVWSMGENSSGQLSNGQSGPYAGKKTFVQAKDRNGFINNVTAIAAGSSHNVVLKNDGTVWTSGGNYAGQLGNGYSGTNAGQKVFVQAKDGNGFINNVTAITAGAYHSIVLKNDGTVWATGLNGNGTLSNGTTTDQKVFVQSKDEIEFISNVTAVATKYAHNLALKSDGTVCAAGWNNYGQLGNGQSGSNALQKVFVQAKNESGFLTAITAIAVGQYHSIVIKKDGTVWVTIVNDETGLHVFRKVFE